MQDKNQTMLNNIIHTCVHIRFCTSVLFAFIQIGLNEDKIVSLNNTRSHINLQKYIYKIHTNHANGPKKREILSMQ